MGGGREDGRRERGWEEERRKRGGREGGSTMPSGCCLHVPELSSLSSDNMEFCFMSPCDPIMDETDDPRANLGLATSCFPHRMAEETLCVW